MWAVCPPGWAYYEPRYGNVCGVFEDMGAIVTVDHSEPVLPEDAEARKAAPIFSGVLDYFPLALAAVARISKRGNDQHNPGGPLHWAREKSTDHEDCMARHLIDVKTVDKESGEYLHAAALAWRALAALQVLEERRLGKSPSRASR